ncbi:MAG: hypothetical protein EOO01_14925, partial [Chitinophagaceae bacterium]
MKASGKKWCISILFVLIGVLPAMAQQADALSLSRRVADKVIADTKFEWKWVLQKEELGMQVIDFRFLSLQKDQAAYALRNAEVKTDTTVRMGISASGKVSIWLNKKLVFQQEAEAAKNPVEAAYNRFQFNHY